MAAMGDLVGNLYVSLFCVLPMGSKFNVFFVSNTSRRGHPVGWVFCLGRRDIF